jgi:hypothetical protein
MPLYQFDLSDGVTRLPGSKTIDLLDDQVAVQYATQIARGLKWICWSVYVVGANGSTVGCVDPSALRRGDRGTYTPKLDKPVPQLRPDSMPAAGRHRYGRSR